MLSKILYFQKLKIFVLMYFVFVSFLAFSKIHLEPYAGYSLTYIDNNESLEKNLLNKNSYYLGPTAGIRLGYSVLGFAVGLDFSVNHSKSIHENTKGFKNTMTPYLYGFFASYKLPLLFRAYASLVHSNISFELEQKNNNRRCKALGTKLGMSYLSLPFLSINFEYLPMYLIGSSCGQNALSHTGTVYANFTF